MRSRSSVTGLPIIAAGYMQAVRRRAKVRAAAAVLAVLVLGTMGILLIASIWCRR